MGNEMARWGRLAVLAGLAALVLSACSVRGNLGNIFGQRTPPPIATVANDHPARGGRVSQNWSGYESLVAGVTSVTATWQVPKVAGPADSDSSTWVGIGGDHSDSLIQAGTEQLVVKGQPQYHAWYELLPAGPQPLDEITPLPGDTVTVTIALAAPNSWQIQATDHDANQTATRVVAYASCECSAEWIEEAPSANGVETTLANFTSVTFTNCAISLRGQSFTFSSTRKSPIRMADALGRTLAQPQVPTGDGFAIVYTAA